MVNLAPHRPRALLITPIAPAPTGNGLAMRAALAVEVLTRCWDLWTAVVPVSDPQIDEDRMQWVSARSVRAVVVDPERPEDAVTGWLGDPAARGVVSSAQPLPARARSASPAAGVTAKHLLGRDTFDVVWVLRLYLAGTIASFLGRSRPAQLILDSDDDDEATLSAIADLYILRGDDPAANAARAEASTYSCFAAGCLPWFDQVLAASPIDARALAERHGLDNVATLRNAVSVGPPPAARFSVQEPNLLFVSNLDYLPNRDAAERLATLLMPAIRKELAGARLHLVGAGGGIHIEHLGREPGVTMHGPVDNLTTLYRRADLAVVPLRAGGGSRLKILDAFANNIPVVATPEAAAGLDVHDGRELLLASSDEELVRAVFRVASDPELSVSLATGAWHYVSTHHELDTVAQSLADRIVGHGC